eukprot:316608-Hanusia_phi.AAC.1
MTGRYSSRAATAPPSRGTPPYGPIPGPIGHRRYGPSRTGPGPGGATRGPSSSWQGHGRAPAAAAHGDRTVTASDPVRPIRPQCRRKFDRAGQTVALRAKLPV